MRRGTIRLTNKAWTWKRSKGMWWIRRERPRTIMMRPRTQRKGFTTSPRSCTSQTWPSDLAETWTIFSIPQLLAVSPSSQKFKNWRSRNRNLMNRIRWFIRALILTRSPTVSRRCNPNSKRKSLDRSQLFYLSWSKTNRRMLMRLFTRDLLLTVRMTQILMIEVARRLWHLLLPGNPTSKWKTGRSRSKGRGSPKNLKSNRKMTQLRDKPQ